MRVKLKDEEVGRSMVFNHFFVSVPRTFGDYCMSMTELNLSKADSNYSKIKFYIESHFHANRVYQKG